MLCHEAVGQISNFDIFLFQPVSNEIAALSSYSSLTAYLSTVFQLIYIFK